MSFTFPVQGTAIDLDAAGASQLQHFVTSPGQLLINQCFVQYEEALGSATTTQGVLSIEHTRGSATVELATLTADRSKALPFGQAFTPNKPTAEKWPGVGTGVNYATAPFVDLLPGDIITVKKKTASAGGTTTGTARPFIALERIPTGL